jgi:hypothetical protein
LLITPAYIEDVLQPRRQTNAPNWSTFEAYLQSSQPEADAQTDPIQVVRSLAVGYLVTGESEYAQRALPPLLGMVDYLQSQARAPWDATFIDYTSTVALAYDWLYPALTPTDRSALADVMLASALFLNDPANDTGRAYAPTPEGTYRFASYDHWGARVLWATAAVGLALFGERTEAAALVDYARNLFTGWMLPTLNDLGGGTWPEGLTYGWQATWANLHTLSAFWTALGENYVDDSLWWYDRLAYSLFAYLPGVTTVGNQAEQPIIWDYPALFGPTERYSPLGQLGRAHEMLLGVLFPGTDRVGWLNWFLAQGAAQLSGPYAVEEFLWRNVSAAESGFPPPWRITFGSGTGQVLMRSDWDLEGGQTVYLAFNAGDRMAQAQFFDAGHLTIGRGGDILLGRAGGYSGQPDGDYEANFYSRTAAANTLLICDLAENFDDILPNRERQLWLNDCGQRPMLPMSPSAVNPFLRADNAAIYETASITRYGEEGGLNYLRADLTPAYNSPFYSSPGNRPKVTDVQREVIYIRPNWVILHDRLSLPDPSMATFQQFHSPALFESDGEWISLQNGDSGLWLRGLAPQTESQLGTGFEVAGELLQPLGNPYENGPFSNHRLRFSNPNAFYLTVMVVDQRSLANLPSSDYSQGDGVYGVRLGDWQVMFDDDAGDISATRFTAQDGSPNLLITGLRPLGNYRVTLPDGTRQDLLADDAGTLYIFMEQSGEVRLQLRR